MKYIKCIGKGYGTPAKVVAYSDRFSIEKAWVEKEKLLVEFSSLEDLQEFNKERRRYPTLGVLDAVDFDTKEDYYCNVLYLYETDDPDTMLFIGTEVETECGDIEDRVAVTKKYGEDEEYIYQMHDCSLDSGGIECITQPMTKAFWDAFDFEGWMAELSDAGARSHDTSDCGLHVHLSREWLRTTDDDEQAVLVARMRQFIADNQPQVERFARRSANHWCEYTKTFDKGEDRGTKEEVKDKHKKKGKCGNRYQSVNNENRNTIEFRIFRGTLKANTYRASVEFCLRLVDYVLTKEDGTETWQDFLEYKTLPASMVQYLMERGLL